MSLFFLPQGLTLLGEGLLLLASASFCLGLTGCSSGPTFYDETTPLTPPPFSPPPLKAIESPLAPELPTTTDSLQTLAEDTEQDEARLEPAPSNPKGPLSSPLSSLPTGSTLSKKPASSNVIRMNAFVKKP